MFWALLGCAQSPDELLRAGKLDEAASAWVAAGGERIDTQQPASQALAGLARHDPAVTFSLLAEMAAASSALDKAPMIKLESLDVSFPSWEPLLTCAATALTPPWRIVVARSEVPADGDAGVLKTIDSDPPYAKGRIVGTVANPPLSAPPSQPDSTAIVRAAALGSKLDANPPVRRVSLLAQGGTAILAIHTEHRDGVWWAISANEAQSGAALIRTCTGG